MSPMLKKRLVDLVPFGLTRTKPHHYREIARAIWENRRELPFARRILTRGVCDGCALGTTGLRDFTMRGIHLCTVRLNLLGLNTRGPLEPSALEDVSTLEKLSGRELRELGRLPFPMLRRRGERGFARISWSEAIDLVASRIRALEPKRIAFYLTSRGLTNEVYYVGQKVARFLGTNNIDNSARLCHAPSTTALKQTIGYAASTCSYRDWIGTQLLVLIGTNLANNQPVATKYIHLAKKQGTRVLVINPYVEPGLERYWVPSLAESALFGTRIADRFFTINTGGDIALLNGAARHLIENGWFDARFVADHTVGYEEFKRALLAQSWDLLEKLSGVSRQAMLELARIYGQSQTAVFVWSMGITQHSFGADSVKAIVNLALLRGMIGREKCGLMPIRGHSGVQGAAEVGAVPTSLPGGVPLDEAGALCFSRLWGFDVPAERGLSAVEMIDAAAAGQIDLLYMVGGNFMETLPEPDYVETAIRRVPFRVHQDIVLNRQMLVEPGEAVLLLPSATRYEQRGGGTETTTERRIIFSPEIAGRRIGEAKADWEILISIAERARPDKADLIRFEDAREIRREIARAVPFYSGIEKLERAGDAIQWGGERLGEGWRFATADGRARFSAVMPPAIEPPPGKLILSTRRGKQFNSMVYGPNDPLTGASRDDVLISAQDAERLGLAEGELVIIKSAVGQMRCRARIAAIKPGNLQVHWPEGQVLLKRGCCDPNSGIPDYNALVELIKTS